MVIVTIPILIPVTCVVLAVVALIFGFVKNKRALIIGGIVFAYIAWLMWTNDSIALK